MPWRVLDRVERPPVALQPCENHVVKDGVQRGVPSHCRQLAPNIDEAALKPDVTLDNNSKEDSICNPRDEAPLTLVVVVRGEAWIVPDSAESVLFDSGV